MVTGRDIELFTELSGDHNPIHFDAELAEATTFGGIVVQGGVTTAILNAVVAEDLPGPGSVFLQLDLRFLVPVRPGETITGSVVVTSVREDKPITGLDVAVRRGDGTVAVEGTAVCYTIQLPDVPPVELTVDLPEQRTIGATDPAGEVASPDSDRALDGDRTPGRDRPGGVRERP